MRRVRGIRNLLVTVLIVLIGFRQAKKYCESNEAEFCRLTSLSRASPWWNEHINPYWDIYVSPCVTKIHEYEHKLDEWAAPRIDRTYYRVQDFVETKVAPVTYKWYKFVQFKSQVYYNGHFVPCLKHMQLSAKQWLASEGFLQRLCLHARQGLFCLRNGSRWVLNESLEAFNEIYSWSSHVLRENLNKSSVSEDQRSDSVEEEELGDIGESRYYDAEYFEGEQDDYNDEDETTYLTSTIIETVTLSGEKQLEKPTSSANNEDASSLDVPLRDLVQDEFQAWSNTVEQKASNTLTQFDSEVEELVEAKLSKAQPNITSLLQGISESFQSHYRIINRAILDVDCTMELDAETGEQLYFNRDGTQLRKYVTRPLMREFFSSAHAHVDERLETVRAQLEKFVTAVNKEVEQVRQEHLEIYEEWGDVMVSEWSKRMAYVDVVAAMGAEDMNQQQHDNWKKFLKLKKQVVNTRDLLMQHPAKLEKLQKFLNDIQFTLMALQRDAGEYLFILRSQANMAFQTREKLEREREEEERRKLEQERDRQAQKEREQQNLAENEARLARERLALEQEQEQENYAHESEEPFFSMEDVAATLGADVETDYENAIKGADSQLNESEDDEDSFYDTYESDEEQEESAELERLKRESAERESLDRLEFEQRQKLREDQYQDEIQHSSQAD
ncbi:LAQU0S14e02564g1_1 [Lachancea quebecensis]|uniref:LAQU0S14e02564g1_1 n=1 Tax=Lachancea quebecensis TaxID=1654605 RepID=A0A0P1KVS9_9SACH|nr:LAQU0S14e02564g1_1 [Lachancea quebecensis]